MHLPRRPVSAALLALAVFAAPAVSAAADLSLAQVKTNPEMWPTQVKIAEVLDYGTSGKIAAGTLVDFVGFEGNNLRFQHRQQFYLLEPELTDLVARANRIASGQAAAEGWRGRIVDYLVRKGRQITPKGFEPIPATSISSDTVFVIYYGSSGCAYCGSALPFLQYSLDLLEQRHPGKIRRVFCSGDADSPAARKYAQTLGAGWMVAPWGDQYLWGGLASLIPGAATSLSYPAVALVTPTGRYLAAGMRQGSHTDEGAAVLRQLEKLLATPAGKPLARAN